MKYIKRKVRMLLSIPRRLKRIEQKVDKLLKVEE